MGGSHLKTTGKKRITVLLTGVLAAGVLSGCGAASGKDNKLTVWTNMEVEAETLQKYAERWAK